LKVESSLPIVYVYMYVCTEGSNKKKTCEKAKRAQGKY